MNSHIWICPHAHDELHVAPTCLSSPDSLPVPMSMHVPTFCAASARIAPGKGHTFTQQPTCSHARNTVQIDTDGPQHAHMSGHICRGPYVVIPRLLHQISIWNPYSRHGGFLYQYGWRPNHTQHA